MKMEKELRKLGATGVNSKDDIGRTPIHIAVIYEKKEALEMLCKQQQKNLNATDSGNKQMLAKIEKPLAASRNII